MTTPSPSPSASRSASEVIARWPEKSKEAAQLVLDEYGEPHEATDSLLLWHRAGPWKRIIATREFDDHSFPAPHIDAVESFIDYRVPPEKFDEIAQFDGSVKADRTRGEVSARCHDLQANFLAINLVHDIVSGERDAEGARQYYAEEFLNFRRKQPTPYMEQLHFQPHDGNAADPDSRVLTPADLERAVQEGKQRQGD